MAKLAPLFFASLLFLPRFSLAAPPVLSSYLLEGANASQLEAVNRLFALEHRSGTGFEVDVPAAQAKLLLALAPSARLLEADSAAALRARLQRFALAGASDYHSFDQVQAWMRDRAAANPTLVTLRAYGVSGEKRPLTAMRLASAKSQGRPVVLITAATHGDELITTEVLIGLVDQLLAGYGHDPRLTALVDNHDLYFVPVVNPDGFTAVNRYDGEADPNRSYPYPQHEKAQPTPSIDAVMQLFASLDVKASIDFHAYGELIMYPWAYTHTPIEASAKARFDALTAHMAEANRYTYGAIADVIYVAPGSSADYYFWRKGSISLGIEVGQEKVPDPSEFPAYLTSQAESTWRFLEGI